MGAGGFIGSFIGRPPAPSRFLFWYSEGIPSLRRRARSSAVSNPDFMR